MKSASLEGKVEKAYIWTTVGNLSKNLAGLAISIALARLVGRQDYGLLTMALVFTGIVAQLQDASIGQAVVYNREKNSDLALYFSLAGVLGGLLTAFVFFTAPLVAAFNHNPGVTPVLRVLSPMLLLGSISSVAQGALTRDFSFRSMALIELAGTVIGGLTGIACALSHFGVWALVVNLLVSLIVQLAFLCYLVPPRVTLRGRRARVTQLLRWGLPQTGSSLLWQVYDNADYTVVGAMLGPAALGDYSMAFRLATLVNSRIASILNRVSFPTFAAVKDDHPELVRRWYEITENLGLLVFPISAILAYNAHDIVLVTVGRGWMNAVVPFQLLCVIGALKGLVATMGNCMAGIGRTDLSFQSSLTNAIVLPVAFILGCRWGGITGVAAAWCVVAPLTFAWFLARTAKLVEASLWEYALCLRSGLVASLGCLVAMLLTGNPLPEGIPRLALRAMVGGAALLAGWWFHQSTRRMIQAYLLAPLRRAAGLILDTPGRRCYRLGITHTTSVSSGRPRLLPWASVAALFLLTLWATFFLSAWHFPRATWARLIPGFELGEQTMGATPDGMLRIYAALCLALFSGVVATAFLLVHFRVELQQPAVRRRILSFSAAAGVFVVFLVEVMMYAQDAPWIDIKLMMTNPRLVPVAGQRLLFVWPAMLLKHFVPRVSYDQAFLIFQMVAAALTIYVVGQWSAIFVGRDLKMMGQILLGIFLAPTFRYHNPHDFGVVLFHTLGLLLLYKRRYAFFVVAFCLGMLNHQNTMLLIPTALVVLWGREKLSTIAWVLGTTTVAYLCIHTALDAVLPVEPAPVKIWWNLLDVLHLHREIILGQSALLFWYIFGAAAWKDADPFIKRASILLPMQYAIYSVIGQMNETRLFNGFIPVLIAIFLCYFRAHFRAVEGPCPPAVRPAT